MSLVMILASCPEIDSKAFCRSDHFTRSVGNRVSASAPLAG